MTPTEIRELRESLELSQKQMAFMLGCYQHHLSRWESGTVKPGKRWQFVLTDIRDNQDDPEMQKRIADAYWS